ncbi:hypothetical protein Phou_081590 [Phytohabitans houttuyneae]|uniref:Uncharacterized protein n=1 Tax=Phytohabitans houttuyneae TaxID=1076126 RepID=A0A6V8KP53_9ACTN|nr:hypothetical protein Phou_081590 [Phytohabitans houttuyneae]
MEGTKHQRIATPAIRLFIYVTFVGDGVGVGSAPGVGLGGASGSLGDGLGEGGAGRSRPARGGPAR